MFTQNFIIIDSVFLKKSKIEVQRDVRKENKAIRLTDTEKVTFSVCIKVHIAVRYVSIAAELSLNTHSFQKDTKKTFNFLPSDNVCRSMHVVMRRQNLCK